VYRYFFLRIAYHSTHPCGVRKWVPASAGKTKAGMVHSVSGWTRDVQVKLWDPLRTRAICPRALEVCSRRGSIQIHVHRLPLPFDRRGAAPISVGSFHSLEHQQWACHPALPWWFSNKYRLSVTKRSRYFYRLRFDKDMTRRDLPIIDNRLWRRWVFVLLATSQKTNRPKDGGQLHHDMSHYIPDKKVHSTSST